MAGDVIYRAELDDTQISKAFRGIEEAARQSAKRAGIAYTSVEERMAKVGKSADKAADEFKDFGLEAEKAGKKAAQSGGDSAAKIGLITGATTVAIQKIVELAAAFVRLGEQAARAFVQAVAGGVKLNEEAENIRISLTAIFGGNQDAADAFLDTIDQVAVRLGASRQELRGFAKSILPDVGDIETTVRLTEQARLLGADAGQSIQSTRIAFEEALSGNLSSLQRRLNVGEKYIKQIEREVAETGNLGDAIANALQKKIEDSGLAIENFADSFTIALNKGQAIITDLQEILGKASFDELKDQINAILGAFDDNKDDIERVVKAFGDLAARIIEIVGSGITDIIQNADYTGLEAIGDNFTTIVNQLDALFQILAGEDFLDSLISGTNTVLENLTSALDKAIQIQGDLSAQEAKQKAEAVKAAELAGFGAPFELGVPGSPTALNPAIARPFLTDAQNAEVAAAGVAAYNDELARQTGILGDLAEAQDDLADKQKERGKQTEKDTTAGKEAGEQYLENQKRLEELAAAEQKAADARENIDEKLTKAKLDNARDLRDKLIKFAREQIDDDIKNAQKREDIETANRDKIDDIFRKHRRRLAEAESGGELSKKEAEIARKVADEKEKIETDAANKRLDIERNYRQELERIRDRFNQTAAEAERNNDAQAFVAAIRQRDVSITDAQRSRDDDLEAAKIDAERKRAELKVSLDQELEDARLNNAQKIEELRAELQTELAEQTIAYERQIRDQDTAEQRQREQRLLNQRQELDDFRQHQAEKMADLQTSLEAEYQLIAEYNQKKIDNAIATAKAMTDAVRNLFNPSRSASTPEGTPTAGTAPTRRGRQSRHSGGGVAPGQTVATLPGETLYTAGSFGGYIVPGPSMTGGMGGGMSVDNRRIIENMNVGGTSDAMEVRKITNIAQQEYLRLMG